MNDLRHMQIAIDGPAGAGKSTIAKRVASALGFTHIDTGAMYRAVTLKALQLGVNLEDEKSFSFIYDTTFEFVDGHLNMDGVDISEAIRENDVSNNVSLVSSYLSVREQLVHVQQQMAEQISIVMDGRDIGYVVLPNATVKFFLTASIETRAYRRHKDNLRRGIQSDIEQLKEDIKRRDHIDSTRLHNPLKKADDAVELDTSHMTIEEVIETITRRIREVEKHGV